MKPYQEPKNHNLSEEIHPSIYTIENIEKLEKEEEKEEPYFKEHRNRGNSLLQTIQTVPLDENGLESIEFIKTAIENVAESKSNETKEKKKKPSSTTAQEIIRRNGKWDANKSYRPTILAIDDNEDVLSFINETLCQEYEIKVASNGYDAWKLLETLIPDLIICDQEMPIINGYELNRLVRSKEEFSSTPFVLLISKKYGTINSEETTSQADALLIKPFNGHSLIATVQKMLRKEQNSSSSLKKKRSDDSIIASSDEKIVEEAVKYVEKNITQSDLSIENLSKELKVNQIDLYKKLMAITGRTPADFIRIIRLKHAALLLKEGRFKITDIYTQVGFSNQKSFDKYFQKEYGVLPASYKEEKRAV
ncbi:MAG: helix-turn-helix domain-containing protein [Phocaeicola sp.]